METNKCTPTSNTSQVTATNLSITSSSIDNRCNRTNSNIVKLRERPDSMSRYKVLVGISGTSQITGDLQNEIININYDFNVTDTLTPKMGNLLTLVLYELLGYNLTNLELNVRIATRGQSIDTNVTPEYYLTKSTQFVGIEISQAVNTYLSINHSFDSIENVRLRRQGIRPLELLAPMRDDILVALYYAVRILDNMTDLPNVGDYGRDGYLPLESGRVGTDQLLTRIDEIMTSNHTL